MRSFSQVSPLALFLFAHFVILSLCLGQTPKAHSAAPTRTPRPSPLFTTQKLIYSIRPPTLPALSASLVTLYVIARCSSASTGAFCEALACVLCNAPNFAARALAQLRQAVMALEHVPVAPRGSAAAAAHEAEVGRLREELWALEREAVEMRWWERAKEAPE